MPIMSIGLGTLFLANILLSVMFSLVPIIPTDVTLQGAPVTAVLGYVVAFTAVVATV